MRRLLPTEIVRQSENNVMPKKPPRPYVIAVLVTTALCFLILAVAEQIPYPFQKSFVLPISIPMILSLSLSGAIYTVFEWAPDVVFTVFWGIMYACICAMTSAIVFLPLLSYSKFKNKMFFLLAQTATIVAHVLLSLPAYDLFSSWMAV